MIRFYVELYKDQLQITVIWMVNKVSRLKYFHNNLIMNNNVLYRIVQITAIWTERNTDNLWEANEGNAKGTNLDPTGVAHNEEERRRVAVDLNLVPEACQVIDVAVVELDPNDCLFSLIMRRVAVRLWCHLQGESMRYLMSRFRTP